MREVNGEQVYEKEMDNGAMTDYVKVSIGTVVLTVPRHIRNPVTNRRIDLTKVSDNGYLKKFLALTVKMNSDNLIDLRNSPVLSFDKDKWELEERDAGYLLFNEEPDGGLGEMLLEEEEAEG